MVATSRVLHRPRALVAVAAALSACGGSRPELGYRVPATASVVYAYGDTTVVGLAIMGQRMEVAMRGSADYAVTFGPAGPGVQVSLAVTRLDAALSMPMAEPERLDASDVSGALVFTLDREGNATVVSAPEVSVAASRMISSLTTAHSFFPGLPARAVSPGDVWVDTVSYEGDAELGAVTEEAIYRYTLVGDTVVDGRSLSKIALAGSSSLSNSMSMGGMQVEQASTVEVTGHVLWDAEAGVMFEMDRRGEGTGSIRIPISPQPIPITVRTVQRARLLGR